MPPRKVDSKAEGKIDAFVSVIAVLDGTLEDPNPFIVDLHRTVSSHYTNYELVLVLNGFDVDRIPAIRDLLVDLPCIRVLRLSRKFAVDVAIFAGLDSAIGDYVVNLTPGMDPVEVVPQIVSLAMEGNDVIQGISNVPIAGKWLRKTGRHLFYGYNSRYLHVVIDERATYLVGLTRRAMNSLANASRTHRYLRHLIRHIGYRLTDYRYQPEPNYERIHSMRSDIITGAEMITSYSSHPLRLVTLIGVLAGAANFLYAIYVVVLAIVRTNLAPGWVSTSLQLSSTFFIFAIILAVQAEYIGRVLAETRKEPQYFIMEEIESDTLIADLDRRNLSS
jgi:polyisoprenyl-phosphate glycosyltransferase